LDLIAASVVLLAASVPLLVCMAAGAAARRGDNLAGSDLLAGFGLLAGVIAALAVLTRLPLSWLMLGVSALTALAWFIRPRLPGGVATWIALLLLSPVLVYAAASMATQWDEFWQWLPNAVYAYTYDSFVWPDRPPAFARFPGYPQGLPLVTVAASFLAGRFLENASAVFNVALLAAFCALLADSMAAVLFRRGRLAQPRAPFVLVAIAVVVAVLLNPGLAGNVLLSSYADSATAITTGALGLIGVALLQRLSAQDRAGANDLAWRFGLIGAALVNLKQPNVVLLALIIAGCSLVVLRERTIPLRAALMQLPRMLGPAVVLYLIWRWYLGKYLPGGEVALRPLSAWTWDALPQMALSAGNYMAQAPLFHGMMWAVAAFGVAALVRPRKFGEAGRLAVVAAVVWLGYHGFLVVSYLGALSPDEARAAADYWRYTPHIAMLAIATIGLGLASAPLPSRLRLSGVVPAAVAAVLALSALPLRSDLGTSRVKLWPHFVRGITAELNQILPTGAKLVLPMAWQLDPYPFIVQYDLLRLPERRVETRAFWFGEDLNQIADLAARGEADYLLIHDVHGNIGEIAPKVGVPAPRHEMVLYARKNGTWEKVRAWPVPETIPSTREE
jgi:hypothetical protein